MRCILLCLSALPCLAQADWDEYAAESAFRSQQVYQNQQLMNQGEIIREQEAIVKQLKKLNRRLEELADERRSRSLSPWRNNGFESDLSSDLFDESGFDDSLDPSDSLFDD
jgi:hypothetical protein